MVLGMGTKIGHCLVWHLIESRSKAVKTRHWKVTMGHIVRHLGGSYLRGRSRLAIYIWGF